MAGGGQWGSEDDSKQIHSGVAGDGPLGIPMMREGDVAGELGK